MPKSPYTKCIERVLSHSIRDSPEEYQAMLAEQMYGQAEFWCHEFDGGRSWYTAGGHFKKHYNDPLFSQHILGGILYAMGKSLI